VNAPTVPTQIVDNGNSTSKSQPPPLPPPPSQDTNSPTEQIIEKISN
jgi:hypothetical protein